MFKNLDQPHLVAFAQYLAFADFVPFEASPQRGQSLAWIAASAVKDSADKVVPVGTGIGAPNAHATPMFAPLLVITVPLGIVLVGGAAGRAVVSAYVIADILMKDKGTRPKTDDPTLKDFWPHYLFEPPDDPNSPHLGGVLV